MNDTKLRDRFHGQTIGEWTAGLVEGVDDDFEMLDAIIAMLRHGFGLSGQALEDAVHQALTTIMKAGGRPTQGHNHDGDCYRTAVTRFGNEPAGIVDGIVAEWKVSGVDPDISAVWFASARRVRLTCRY